MNNKYPQLTFVFDRRNKASLTTKAAVELRIYYNYRQKYISTGIMLYANQWKNNKIINCPDAFHISSTLNELLTNVRQILLEMMEEGISSHWARHTGATLLLNEGIPLQIVSKICGHSSSKITEQIYAKLLDETIVKAVLNVDI